MKLVSLGRMNIGVYLARSQARTMNLYRIGADITAVASFFETRQRSQTYSTPISIGRKKEQIFHQALRNSKSIAETDHSRSFERFLE